METSGLMLKISGVMPIHNEEEYLPYSLNSLLKAPLDELIVILDRCNDKSEEIIRHFNPNYLVKIHHKTWQKWDNPIAEVCECGFSLASGDILYDLFADCVYDPKIFDSSLFEKYDMVSYRYYNRDLHRSPIRINYEILLSKLFQKIDFKQQVWRGAIFATKKKVWEKLRFRDSRSEYGEHSQFQDYKERLVRKGYKYHFVKTTRNVHLRAAAFSKKRQLLEGKGRVVLQYPLWRVITHSILHLKPYVLVGYVNEIRQQ